MQLQTHFKFVELHTYAVVAVLKFILAHIVQLIQELQVIMLTQILQMIHPYNFSRVTALYHATQVPQNRHLQNITHTEYTTCSSWDLISQVA